MAQDPVLGRLKLIAEPWDLGPGGYRQGQFPPPFAMWNDRYRDCVRRFWRGDEAIVPELAGRLLGSADLYEAAGRRPQVSVNLITSHDGFTLSDLVSYATRHNEANGEHNRDGHHDNLSANHGAEGPTDDPSIRELRGRQQRNLLATLLFAQGTPMILMGDELGRSQSGNNNAYCQDNDLSWLTWPEVDNDAWTLNRFLSRLIELRRGKPLLRQSCFLHGEARGDLGLADVSWLATDGRAMAESDWQDPRLRCFGLMLADGDAALLLLFNAAASPRHFVLPKPPGIGTWGLLLDTARPDGPASTSAESLSLADRSLVLLEFQASLEPPAPLNPR